MLKIGRIALPKEQLQKLTGGERSLFLLLGYASNQINAVWKLVVVDTNEGTKDRVEEKLAAAQIQSVVRLLIGIMREALKLIEKRFLGSPLGKEYVPRLSPQAGEALDRLKKRFGAPDKFVKIRDNFAFHHHRRSSRRPSLPGQFCRFCAFRLQRCGGRRHRLPYTIATCHFNRRTPSINFHFRICVLLRYQGGLYLQYSGDLTLHFAEPGLNRLYPFPHSHSAPYQDLHHHQRADRERDVFVFFSYQTPLGVHHKFP